MAILLRLNIFKHLPVAAVFALLLWASAVHAQESLSQFQELKKAYPDETLIQLDKKVSYRIFLEKGELAAEVDRKEKYLYLKNLAMLSTDKSVYTSEWHEITDFEANSYYLKNDKYKKVKVKDYKEKVESSGHIFYDDTRELVFTFPSVSEGSVIELNTTHKIHEPRILSSIYINSLIPINNFEFTIEIDEEIDLNLDNQQFMSDEVKFEKTSKGSKNIYKWSGQNLSHIKEEKFMPDPKYFAPHIIPIVEKYRDKDRVVDVLSKPKDLYSWYYTFIEDVNKDINTKELQAVVDTVTAGCETELEKVEKLFYWVQKNIKYIAFEYGMGGFVPRKADDVCSKRYGDCKDKTSILHALLDLAGIESYFTWIGTRDIPYSYHQVPSPVTDNHMILTYINGDDYYFLDGTGSYLYLGLPSSFIQDKEALIGKGPEEFEIKKVPKVEARNNAIIDHAQLQLDGTKLKGTGKLKLSGYPKTDFQYGILGLKDDDLKEMVEFFTEKGSNKFVLKEYEYGDGQSFDPQIDIEYEFELDDYVNSVNDKIYINLNLYQDWLLYKLEDDRVAPVNLRYASLYNHEFQFRIPKGYEVDFLPENKKEEWEDFDYSINYSVENGVLIYRQEITVDLLMIKPENFKAWGEFIKSLEKAYKETVVLTLKE